MLNLFDELIAIAKALNEAGVKYALCGGLAYSAYCEPRATQDIDLAMNDDQLEKALEAVKPLGYVFEALPMEFSGGSMSIVRRTKIEGRDYTILDILVPRGRLSDTIDGAEVREVAGIQLPVVTREGLIRLKLERNSDRDKLDIANLRKSIDDDSTRQ